MARELDFQCKLCRREGIKLYLKGARCEGPKCAIERRNQSPGMHWQRRSKASEYGVRLREKQKLKRFYGVLERQFRRYFALAARSTENTGEALLSIMERRLDNVVHRLGWAPSRYAARQLLTHGHITVNGKACDIPSLLLKAGDVVAVKNRPRSMQLVKLNMTQWTNPVPDFLTRAEGDPPSGTMLRLPGRMDVDPRLTKDRELREQLIIEVAAR
jgi:small subunit ribosomal protein S4